MSLRLSCILHDYILHIFFLGFHAAPVCVNRDGEVYEVLAATCLATALVSFFTVLSSTAIVSGIKSRNTAPQLEKLTTVK